MSKQKWTRTLAVALVLPLAAACAETGQDEIDETETLETTPTTDANRVELEPFGTTGIEGWVTSRIEGDEVVLTLNLDGNRTGTQSPGDVGAEADLPSARLIEGMCMDVRPESERPAAPTGQAEEAEPGTEQEPVETVAEFEEPEEGSGNTIEARVSQSEIRGFSYAVVVEDDESGEASACADVTQLVVSPAAGSRDQPAGDGEIDGGSDERGTNY